MDGEFACLITNLAGIGLTGNIMSKGERIPGIEWQNRVKKGAHLMFTMNTAAQKVASVNGD
eukprot:12902620-Ditylum_brightwellii.AAC.1